MKICGVIEELCVFGVCVVEGASRFHFILWAPCLVLCIHFLCPWGASCRNEAQKSSHEVCRDCGKI